MTLRERLLAEQDAASQTIHSGEQQLPLDLVLHKRAVSPAGEDISLPDFVGYCPSKDEFSLFVNGKNITFKGNEFGWIYSALSEIGTEPAEEEYPF